jgi:hypothetical protein
MNERIVMAQRGILYLYWGEKYKKFLDRSIESVRRFHPELPIHVETLPDSSTFLDKARMYEMSPFDETLFLDIDTVVLGNLEFGFQKAQKYGLACSICECPWARRYGGLTGDIVEYNTGVLFFTDKSKLLFDSWAQCVTKVDSSIKFYAGDELRTMPHNDQAGFAHAVEETGFMPYVLPYNWNFRPEWHHSFFGPIKIWHDYGDVPKAIIELNKYYEGRDSVIQFITRPAQG